MDIDSQKNVSEDRLRSSSDRMIENVFRIKCGVFFFAFVSGFLIWKFSPYFTGKVVPWDAESYYYSISFIIAGMVSGFSGQRLFWFWPIALYIGQSTYIIVYALTHHGTNVYFYWPLGLVFGLRCLVPGFIGSAMGSLLRFFLGSKL